MSPSAQFILEQLKEINKHEKNIDRGAWEVHGASGGW